MMIIIIIIIIIIINIIISSSSSSSSIFIQLLCYELDVVQVNFFAKYSRLEFRFFLLLDWLSYQRRKNLMCSTIYPLLEERTWRRVGFIPFLRALARSEMQTASSRIWTGVADSISCDDNR